MTKFIVEAMPKTIKNKIRKRSKIEIFCLPLTYYFESKERTNLSTCKN